MEIADISTHGLPRIIVLGGPTGVGKTRFSLALAERFGMEVVNYDSVQLYRGLDIGAAKPSLAERGRAPHHLFDILWPDEENNVADYMARAHQVIAEVHARGKMPLLVGGTGMYARILVHGLFEAPQPDAEIRRRHREIVAESGPETLFEMLTRVDPELAGKLHPNDVFRVSRGLEIFEQTQKPMSQHQREHRFRTPNYDALKIGLTRPRDELYARINQRVDQMMAAGLLQEYQGLIAQGYGPALKPLQALGYRQMGAHVFEGVALEDAVEDMKSATRRYAKQQLNWFRSEPKMRWADAAAVEPSGADGALSQNIAADIAAALAGTPLDQIPFDWLRGEA